MRAFIRQPRRKAHLAHLDTTGIWTTYCDLISDHVEGKTDVREFDHLGGVTARTIQQLEAIARDYGTGNVCANCRRMIMLMKLIQHDRSHGLASLYTFAA